MLPRADLNPTRPPASLEAATPVASATDAKQEVFRRLTQIAIGKELQATVASMFDDGTYLVNVGEATARMALPVGTRVGDTLSMVFVAKEPVPTFLLLPPEGSAPASLSTTARLIDQLLQQQTGSAAVHASEPLLALKTMDAASIAKVLASGIAASGLFYESHLQDWLNGSRGLADIAAEPQARLPASQAAPQQGQDLANPDLSKLAAGIRELGDGAHKLLELIRTAQEQSGSQSHTDANLLTQPQAALPKLDPQAAHLIGLQLGVLEQQQIRWQGELWPGQAMEWEISDDTPGNGSPEEREREWSSVVRFELPRLGKVSATLHLSGNRVAVQVQAASEATADLLRANGGQLALALEAAGSPLDSLRVSRDEPQ